MKNAIPNANRIRRLENSHRLLEKGFRVFRSILNSTSYADRLVNFWATGDGLFAFLYQQLKRVLIIQIFVFIAWFQFLYMLHLFPLGLVNLC